VGFVMKQEVIQILTKYKQEHILDYINLLNEEEQKNLEKQILKIDFEQLQKLYEQSKKQEMIEEGKIEHISYIDKQKLEKTKKEELEQIGKTVITSGKYAVLTMAGGQGTRLRAYRTKRNLLLTYSKRT
jgi:UDP-N-acetylglucosamine/UDP-N-acetylgalactosamine diphosphorylase